LSGAKGKFNVKKIAAVSAAVLLTACFILAGVYVAAHAYHDCPAADTCPVCACIQSCKKFSGGLSSAVPAAIVVQLFAAFLFIIGLCVPRFSFNSLTSLKIRLND
jgi:hypothetical protein